MVSDQGGEQSGGWELEVDGRASILLGATNLKRNVMTVYNRHFYTSYVD